MSKCVCLVVALQQPTGICQHMNARHTLWLICSS